MCTAHTDRVLAIPACFSLLVTGVATYAAMSRCLQMIPDPGTAPGEFLPGLDSNGLCPHKDIVIMALCEWESSVPTGSALFSDPLPIYPFILSHVHECFPTCMSTYVITCMQCLWRPQEGNRSPRSAVTEGCVLPHGCWELSQDPRGEQPELLHTGASFSFWFLSLKSMDHLVRTLRPMRKPMHVEMN